MITISPANPTNVDTITLTVTGFNGGVSSATLIDNNPAFIAEVTDLGSFGDPYTYNFQIGPLNVGNYTMTHKLLGFTGPTILTEQITVNVTQAANPPATAVPSISFLGLAMLTTILLATGKYYFKKK